MRTRVNKFEYCVLTASKCTLIIFEMRTVMIIFSISWFSSYLYVNTWYRKMHLSSNIPCHVFTIQNFPMIYQSYHNILFFFNVLLTVHLCITLANNQLHAQFFYFIISLLQSSTCFEQRRAHHQEVKLY